MSDRRLTIPDGFMTVQQILADHPDLDRRTINYWMERGLPFTKVGSSVLIHRDDLTDWMTKHVRKTVRWRLVDLDKAS